MADEDQEMGSAKLTMVGSWHGEWVSLHVGVYHCLTFALLMDRAAGSANSLTALMTVDEAEEVDEAHIDSAAAMDMLSGRRPPVRRSMHIEPSQPELRTEFSADLIENAASALHSLQQQDR